MSAKPTCPNAPRALIAGYANYFEVGHNAFEFLIDFGQIDPQTGEVHINSRLALGPTHAKLFANLLHGSVSKFEEEHGAIPEVRNDEPLAPSRHRLCRICANTASSV